MTKHKLNKLTKAQLIEKIRAVDPMYVNYDGERQCKGCDEYSDLGEEHKDYCLWEYQNDGTEQEDDTAYTKVGVIGISYRDPAMDTIRGIINTYAEAGTIPFVINSPTINQIGRMRAGRTVSYTINNTGTVPRAENVELIEETVSA